MQTSPGGLFCSAVSQKEPAEILHAVSFSPAMVREEVVNFKLPKALYDMGQAVVDTGGAESMFIVD